MDVALKSVIDIAKRFDSELILLHVLPEEIVNDSLKSLVKEKWKILPLKLKKNKSNVVSN